MLNTHVKILAITFILLFLSSCGDKSTEVTAGVAGEQTIFTKTCSAGSFKITKEKTLTADGVPTVLNLNNLPLGALVKISGTINSGGCGFTGAVSFSCKASVSIDTNRTFSCISNYAISGIGSSLGTPTLTTNPINPTLGTPTYNTVNQKTLIAGKVHTFNNGTENFVELTVLNPPFGACPLSFICK